MVDKSLHSCGSLIKAGSATHFSLVCAESKLMMKLLFGLLVAVSCSYAGGQRTTADYENCLTLGDSRLQAAWTVRSDVGMIDFFLCGCAQDETQSEDDVYMAFGLSADSTRTLMMGADATVAWVDRWGRANAVDYHLSAYIQCVAGAGACPDTLDGRGGCTNDVFSVSGYRDGLKQCVAFSRNFTTTDDTCDLPIDPENENQYIVWATGGLGSTAFKHFAVASATEMPVHLGRSPPINSCSSPIKCPDCPPFVEKVMDVRGENATFIVNIGPTGLDRGYMAIADQSGWGNSIYLNGTLIPRLRVQRHRTYTFICETGNNPDPQVPGGGNFHPFYITDSRTGGRLTNSLAQQNRETVYAGFNESNSPLGIGPYCEYSEGGGAIAALDNCDSFDQYLSGLVKGLCRSDDPPGVFSWTPDDNTPNTVYYQCATHSNFGYEISVESSGASALLAHSTGAVILITVLTLLLPV